MSAHHEATPSVAEQPWRERDGRVVLLASRRAGHAGLHFPPLPETSPLREGGELVELDSTPRLYSFTVVHFSPKANKPPQPLGLADFPEGLRVFARLDYPAGRQPRIGEALSLCLVESDSGPIYAFRPQEDA
ncbi:OB-fold domain-containing protein [Pseudomonas nitroreducens]|uniref:Zn-ribbon domain-containing OB-fold protein n=1 Tax=Pseudomonas nitroreducens TaxID=46680 RepID=UPI00147406A5|nr:OB-fold domain-containing protein [Pseudomonas nitroreducens]MCJ1878043.1 OB-fold domain-containing protein [Pseudomonas nitroreducens]MCJ1894440.1 OB-fold domain-containing protein [Pseudomonas nitroreducens]MDG9857721.1 OB-fold domain-containing protein [Pseudomonas nitroreducens]MDH1076295.1 OB-fold domain-containing protein [Pseudomonas nitroreducens]NMZ73668.1 OB-fold domain-containing protein [Pseudomonas nitroreducens]